MSIHSMFSTDIISIILLFAAWTSIVVYFVRTYRKLLEKPAKWKVLLVAIAGLFSFSINVESFGDMLKIPVLPLGVWIAYGFLRNRSWTTYRRFAWAGFAANFIFLSASLIAVLLHLWIYPKADVATYISRIEEAAVIGIHPAAQEGVSLRKDRLEEELKLKRLQNAEIQSDLWYQDAVFESSAQYKQERFPYQLIGVKAAWGSGISSVIYIENDGKGLLLTTAVDRQYYYRFPEPLIEGVALHDEQQ